MENAAKGLLMAGGILIAVIVLSVGVRIFTTYSDGTQPYHQNLTEQEIWAFNNKFLNGKNENDKVTIQEVISMVNLAMDTKDEEIPVIINFKNEEYGYKLDGTSGTDNSTSEALISTMKDNNNTTNEKPDTYTIQEIKTYKNTDSNPYIVGAIKEIIINER